MHYATFFETASGRMVAVRPCDRFLWKLPWIFSVRNYHLHYDKLPVSLRETCPFLVGGECISHNSFLQLLHVLDVNGVQLSFLKTDEKQVACIKR